MIRVKGRVGACKSITLLACLIFFSNFMAGAMTSFEIEGNIRSMTRIGFSIATIEGKVILKCEIDKTNSQFHLGPVELIPDLYVMNIGKTKEQVFLSGSKLKVSGYYDDEQPENSNLSFQGLDEHFRLMGLGLVKYTSKPVDPALLKQVHGSQASTLAYLFANRKYDVLKPFFDCAGAGDINTYTGKWLKHVMDSLSVYASGIKAPVFTLPDNKEALHHLADFGGKIVVLDFWASWCGPCRTTMKQIKTYYTQFKDKVQFISVSVDQDKNKWLSAEKEEAVPWLSLWDSTGFGNDSFLRNLYGFSSIPFIAIVDKDGMVLRRDIIDAKQLREELDKLWEK